MGELQKRIDRGYPVEDRNIVMVKQGEEVEWVKKDKIMKAVEDMKKEIDENTLPNSPSINLGDFVLVDKKTLEKWLGDEQP